MSLLRTSSFTLYFFFFLLLITACGEKDPFADCQYGRPQPIFSAQTSQVTQHAFGIRDMQGVEQIVFANKNKLELIQKGCDNIIQEFTFELPGTFKDETPDFWIRKAIEQFDYLSQLEEQYADLGMWAQAIGAVSAQMKLGEKTEVQPGFFVKLNRIVSTDYAILTVEFSQGTGVNS